MKVIKSLSALVDQQLFAEKISQQGKLHQLFVLSLNETVLSDADLCCTIYGDNSAMSAYKQLKVRLRRELVLFISRSNMSQDIFRWKAESFELAVLVSGAEQLASSNRRKDSIVISEYLLPKCINHECTELTIRVAQLLHHYYGALVLDAKLQKKYEKILNVYTRLYNMELEVKKGYVELRSLKSRYVDTNNRVVRRVAAQLSERMQPYLDAKPCSYELLLEVYLVLLMKQEIYQEHTEVLKLCDRAIEIFSRFDSKRRAGIYLFTFHKVACLVKIGEYTQAMTIVDRFMGRLTRGSVNWYSLCLYKLICLLHVREYIEAQRFTREVLLVKSTVVEGTFIVEIWRVYSAYMEFLSKHFTGTVDSTDFRIAKFLNEVPIYSKDKRGLNIAILIIQFLFLLQQHKYSKVIDRVESLKQYCYRYLRKDDTFRSHCFIRMLLEIPKADFNRIRTERYAAPYLKKLKSVPLRVSEQSIEVEVIPYEDLWEMTLDLLD